MSEEKGLTVIDAEFQEAQLPAVFSPDTVLKYFNFIKQVQAKVMKKDVHYGTIPGTKKPTLFKAGAEALCSAFRLAATFDTNMVELGEGHREYKARCKLHHIDSGVFVGEGVGSCSTMEKKYRWRGGEPVSTGVEVPKEYWKKKTGRDQSLLGGRGFTVSKIDSKFYIMKAAAEKVENPDIADTHNTCLKMACKRAYVMATIVATGASDVFTQDVEDMPATPQEADTPEKPPAKPPATTNKAAAGKTTLNPPPKTQTPPPETQPHPAETAPQTPPASEKKPSKNVPGPDVMDKGISEAMKEKFNNLSERIRFLKDNFSKQTIGTLTPEEKLIAMDLLSEGT